MSNFRSKLLVSTLLAGAAFAVTPAGAQTVKPGTADAPPTPAAPDSATQASIASQAAAENAVTTTNDVVVTGTLIRNPNLIASSPVNVINEAAITLRAPNTAEEILRELPGVVPGIGSQVNNGSNGINTVDLRGLGSQRNLVLLDGNRLVPSLANGAVDLDIIPVALIQRTEVLTGGASTTYGADAVSGVVNFITRRDFTGIDLRAQYRFPEAGEGKSYRTDLTVGANFADDKGNAVLNLSYTSIDPIYQTAGFSNFGISSTTGVASGASGTSVPTAIAFNNGDFVQVTPDGSTLVPQYQGFNFNPYNIFQTPIERKSAYAAARYDVADNVEVYARGLFSQNTIRSIIAPSGIFGLGFNIPANNPYLNAGVRGQICAENFASDVAAANAKGQNATVAAAYLTDAARYTPATCGAQTGTVGFVAPTVNAAGVVTDPGVAGNSLALPGVYRRTVEVGPRISNFENNLYDARAGVRVNITKSLTLDVSGSYGRSEQIQAQTGYVINTVVQQALNANNTATCLDPSNGCVPLNLFGPAGSITAAQVGFIQGASSIRINTELKQARALLTGDFGYTVPFASNPVSFAVGGEHREYTYERIPDAFAQNPSSLGGAGGAVLPFKGGYKVNEGFGELIAPIASGHAFLDELTLEAGIRYSAYTVQAPNNPSFNATTYKGGATFQPVAGVRFRGNYQRAVRAPNIGELFAPVTTALTNLTVDPCSGTKPVGNVNLTAVCIAQGASPASIGAIRDPNAGQANGTGGGNTAILPEKADTYTLGVVLTPTKLVRGFNLAVDYYNIVVNGAITAQTPGDAIAACFNNVTAASATSPACTAIRRNPAGGGLSGPAATTPGLFLPETNSGRLQTDGVDLTANYQRTFGLANLALNFVGNYTRHNRFAASPTSVNRDCVGFYSVNCGAQLGQIQPKYSFQQRTTVTVGPASLSLLWRYINPVDYEGTAADFAARGFKADVGTFGQPGYVRGTRFLYASGQPGRNATITNGNGGASVLAGQTADFNHINAFHYFDANLQFNITSAYQLTLGVRNLTNKQPPVVGGQAGSTAANSGNTFPSTYDPIGRSYSAAVRLKF